MITHKGRNNKFFSIPTIPGQSRKPPKEPPGWKRRVTLEELLENNTDKPITQPVIKPKSIPLRPKKKKQKRKNIIE